MRRPYLSTSVPGACFSAAVSTDGVKDAKAAGVASGFSDSLCMISVATPTAVLLEAIIPA